MCYNPIYIKVKEYEDLDTGEIKKKVFFNVWPEEATDTVPCGKCAECLFQKSNEWAFRIMAEARYHSRSCFLTLTYKDSPGTLNKRDYQLFLKRLRKKVGSFRYFLCGEYGSKGKRPHYHVIIFGYWPEDAEPVLGTNYYSSKEVEDTWSKGFISVGELTLYDAKYCAKYMQKLQSMPANFVQPFVQMSLKPGLGFQYFEEHRQSLLKTDKIYHNGDYIKLPRYFLKRTLQTLSEADIDNYTELKDNRSRRAILTPNTEKNLKARKLKYKKLLT